MQRISEIDLPTLRMGEPEFAIEPFKFFAEARQAHGWLAKAEHGLVVTEYKAIIDLLRQDDKMRTANDQIVEIMNARDTRWGRFIAEEILAKSGEEHSRLRSIVAPMFTPSQANKHRHLMREMMDLLLDEWCPRESFDFEEFASYYPIAVITKMIGADVGKIPALRASLEVLGLSFSMDSSLLPKLEEATIVLEEFIEELVADRRADKGIAGETDLLDLLLKTSDDGLTDRELYDLLLFLFIAGYDTSKNVLTLTMQLMLDRPEIYERCAEDLSFCRFVTEESLRLHSPSTIPRLTVREIIYRDTVIPAGTMMFFPVSISGRDPSYFTVIDDIDLERRNTRPHTAFGMGQHMCLGQFIARAQVQEGLHLLARRIRNPRLAGAYGYRPFPGVWGLRGLPITFTCAPTSAARSG